MTSAHPSQQKQPLSAVIGAGTMGHGIAQVLALAGHQVLIWDEYAQALAQAPARIERSLGVFIELGLVSQDQASACLARISLAESLARACDGVSLVIEAVIEDLPPETGAVRPFGGAGAAPGPFGHQHLGPAHQRDRGQDA